MSVSLPLLFHSFPAILAATIAVLLIKTTVIALTCWLFGSAPRIAFRTGVTLCQAGEFSIVLLAAAKAPALGLINAEQLSFCITVIVLSLIVTPSLIQLAHSLSRFIPADHLAPWARHSTNLEALPASAPTTAPTGPHAHKRAIIAGYGLVGRVVADKLKSIGMASTIVEMNPATVSKQSALGRSIVFGDIANPDTLESVGVAYADTLILTIPDEETVLRACKLAREMNPNISIIARTSFMSRGITAATLGATGVVVEEMATAEAMEAMTMKVLAMPSTSEPPVPPRSVL